MEENRYITSFRVKRLWRRIDINWKDVNEDVNILVGINGCGKTSLLDLIAAYYRGEKVKKGLIESMEGNDIGSPVTYIRSFDVPANIRKKNESILLQELKSVINQNGEGTSFFDYRMKMLNFPEQASVIQSRIDEFFRLVNTLFAETGKEVMIDPMNNTLVFSVKGTSKEFRTADGKGLYTTDGKAFYTAEDKVQLEQLSSGEKQVLLILTTVFLQECKPNVLLMDEPEISLHISWQDRLIGIIRELNPNCQLILTTHSPNIFADGWEDKIVFMKDLIEN